MNIIFGVAVESDIRNVLGLKGVKGVSCLRKESKLLAHDFIIGWNDSSNNSPVIYDQISLVIDVLALNILLVLRLIVDVQLPLYDIIGLAVKLYRVMVGDNIDWLESYWLERIVCTKLDFHI